MTHLLYLVRHGEQQDAEFGVPDGPLSQRGQEQARLLGERLVHVPFDEVFTSPLDRAVETADLIVAAGQLPKARTSTLLFDCVPSGPEGAPEAYDSYFSGHDPMVFAAGEAQIADAIDTWFTRPRALTHTLLVTHNAVIGAMVAAALELPSWRWLTLTSAHASVSVLKMRPNRPTELVLFGGIGHLPLALRTGQSDDGALV